MIYNIGMYNRKFDTPPKKLIKNGQAAFGTYSGVSPKIDIRGMHAPYAGIPMPVFLSNLRIKSCLRYVFSVEKYIGFAQFYDFKALGLAQTIIWDKNSGKKYVYHVIMPPRLRFVPNDTTRGICASYRKSRFMKISWGRHHQHNALTLNLKGDNVRPNIEALFYSLRHDTMYNDAMFVNPSPSSSRVSATWFSPMSLHSRIKINDEMAESDGLGMMILNRAYFKMQTKTTVIQALGKIKDQNVEFSISSSNLDAADADSYNNNVLVVDGKITALPSVYITHPFGINEKWVIQDTESMIDLTFTPVSINSSILNLIALRTSYNTIYGTFEGVLLTSDGEKIPLKNFPGILQKGVLRI